MNIAAHPEGEVRGDQYYNILLGLCSVFAYSLLYYYIYKMNIFPAWEYLDFRMYAKDNSGLYVGLFLIASIYITIPKVINRSSDQLIWLLYILAFIPIQITLGISGTIHNVYIYQAALFLSFLTAMVVANAGGWYGRARLARRCARFEAEKGPGVSRVLFVLALIFAVILIVRFHSIMNLAGMTEIYEQREKAVDYGINRFYGYLILWLTYSLSPLLLLYGFFSKKPIFIFSSIFSVLTVFSITASKAALVVIAFSLAALFLGKVSSRRSPYVLTLLPAIPMILMGLSGLLLGGVKLPVIEYLLDVVVVRGVAVQAKNYVLYAEFFSQNPLTYYSHVTGISWIVSNPYNLPLGEIVSIYATGRYDGNANAGIWSTDGLAAAGNIGVVGVGVILGVVLRFLNRLTSGINHAFGAAVVVPLAMLMVNVSMFTTLASGGGVLLILMIRPLWREVERDRAPRIDASKSFRSSIGTLRRERR